MSLTTLVQSSADFPAIRACIFDVDGLLINSEDIYTEIYNNILHQYGKPSYPWIIKATQQSRGRQGTLRLLDWAQLPLSAEEFNAKVAAQRELFRKSTPLSGVPELLKTLSSGTLPIVSVALASSASRSAFDIKTSHLPCITGAFPTVRRVFGDDPAMQTKHGKPAPDIFLLALGRINDSLNSSDEPKITAEECLVFEDSIAGVEAGRRAGMRVVWCPHEGLLEVCRGRELLVLDGETEKDGDGVGSATGGKEVRDQSADGYLWKSNDGRAELLTSLAGFTYEHYGIRLRSSEEV